MRKLLIALSVILLLGVIVVPYYSVADDNVSITVENNITAVPGKDFTVSVSISDNPGITVVDFSVRFDTSYMTLKEITFSDFLTSDPNVVCEVSGRRFTITSSEPITRNGEYVILRFTLKSDIDLGHYGITVEEAEHGILGSSGSHVDFSVSAGGVTLECYHNYKKTVFKPTCSSQGYTEYYCTECNVKYISDYVEKLDHKWRVSNKTSPTCTEDGRIVKICNECGEVVTEKNGEALGHEYGEVIVVEPTCQHDGYSLSKCSRCGEEVFIPGSETSKTGHKFVETFRRAPTCSEPGIVQNSCIYCGLTETKNVNVSDHRWAPTVVSPTHESGGWTVYTCTICGVS
ncbi:MAG: hypothetical protein J5850_02135, partial [Clostridia bacterium]|nr:hypothetical protein [Clostridia bacterium]